MLVRSTGTAGSERMATDEHEARPASRWARFARPAPGEERPPAPVEPPRPLRAVPQAWAPAEADAGRPALVGAPPARDPRDEGDERDERHGAGTWPPVTDGGHVVGSHVAPASASAGSPFDRWGDDDWPEPSRAADDASGRSLAIASIVFAVFAAPVGLVLGLVASARARRSGASTRLAAIGIVLACVVIVVSVVWGVAWLDHAVRLAAACRRVGPGEYLTGDGSTVTCS